MATIDHRILIPAAPDVVWDVLKDINKNPHWQVDCQEISFLSSKRDGPGLRWRYANAQANEFVVEVTAWYDGLGYEYTYVDGAPFRESRGRIRLQEIPEGTVIQWNLNYKIGGVFSAVRDMNVRRQFEKNMVESLKALYTYIKKSGAVRDIQEAKSLMRDALDYEARSQYVPRHPSRYSEEKEAQPEPAGITIPEPPLADEDTRPNPALAETPAEGEGEIAIRQPVRIEPAPAAPLAEETTTDDLQPEAASQPEEEPHARFKPPEVTPESPAVTSDDSAEAIEASAQPEPADAPQAPQPQSPPELEPVPEFDPYGPVIDTSQMDTKEVSIWQVFGVERPSDTRPMQPITGDDKPAAEAPTADAAEAEAPVAKPAPEPAPVVAPTRRVSPVSVASPAEPVRPLPYGFRLRARRLRVKIRRRA